jgi:hypothetical protein
MSLTRENYPSCCENYRKCRLFCYRLDAKVPGSRKRDSFKYLVANATLFGYLFHILVQYGMEVEIYIQYFAWGCLWFCRLDVDLQLGCIGAELM